MCVIFSKKIFSHFFIFLTYPRDKQVIQASKKSSVYANHQEQDHHQDVVYSDNIADQSSTAEAAHDDHVLIIKQDHDQVVDVPHIDKDQYEANSSTTSFNNCWYMNMNLNFPFLESVDETNMSFVYDTTNFQNDSLLDFLGGSMTHYNYSRSNAAFESFGSVDNLSLDDYY